MARAAGDLSAKRAKVNETGKEEEEEEDPLVRRREELVRLLGRAKKGKDNARAMEELLTLCADLQAKNEKLLRRLPPELWQKILDENLHKNDLLALTMTCRFFRQKQKDLGLEVETHLHPFKLLDLQKGGKMASHTLGWFQWVCDTMEIRPGFKWSFDPKSVKGAVYEGNLVNYAALQGSVEILRWLMEEKGWEPNVLTGGWAGMGGSIEVLEYLRERGYQFDGKACGGKASDGAARGGHLEALKFLRGLDPPCPWSSYTCCLAAKGGHLDVLKWCRSQNPPCRWSSGMCATAAERGHLDVLKWCRSQNPPCPWSAGTCSGAACGGHLDVLKWLRAQTPPCPWTDQACVQAAYGGHLEVLKWLRSQDPPCPWHRSTCSKIASKYGHQNVIDWIGQQED